MSIMTYLLLGVLTWSLTTSPLYASTIYFNHSDHLNSTRGTTNEQGGVENIYEYSPYGSKHLDEKNGSFTEQRQFGGHEFNGQSDLYYLGSRYLAPSTGRFLSIDPLGRDKPEAILHDPQRLNLYSYGKNNPLRFIDDTGEAAKDFQRLVPTQPLANATGQPVLNNGRRAFSFASGQRMATYKGVPLLSNGDNTGTGLGSDRQQCVGFAKAFYQQIYGVSIGRVGTATGLTTTSKLNSVSFDASGQRQFKEFRNGLTTTLPREDDLVGWRGGSNGHVGVVVSVNFNPAKNSGFMDVAEQNWGQGSFKQSPISRHQISRNPDSGRITIADRNSYQLYNWLRLESK